MTRPHDFIMQCFVCGTRRARSAELLEPPSETELRHAPKEMVGSAVAAWVRACAECGYCAPDLSVGHRSARAKVRSPEYQRQLHAAGTPPLAARFLCAALLSDAAGQPAKAAQQRLYAAQAFEEAGEVALARQYNSAVADALLSRRKVLLHWRDREADWRGSEAVVLVDVLRRAGRFDEARREVEAALRKRVSSIVKELLRFERSTIERGDTGPHSQTEALGAQHESKGWYGQEDPLLEYLMRYYKKWMTPQESKAAGVGRLATPEGERWATDDLEVQALLARGKQAFASTLEQRLLREHPGEVVINRCPKCGGVARTPRARQCRFCAHSWREADVHAHAHRQ
ncbi:MAG: hypothetical protein JXB05_32760 [Myxococcaceae bacterium]|nr:hypothetical protein [Myxococcaceae bacterium]